MNIKGFIIAAVLLLVVLVVRVSWFFLAEPPLSAGQQIFLQGTLQQEPKVGNRGQLFTMKMPNNQAITVQTGFAPRYHYGDKLAIRGSLQASSNEKGHVFYRLNYPHITQRAVADNIFSEASIWIRRQSLALISDILPPTSASLLLGIVYGAKEDFPSRFNDALQSAGVFHVIAASGANVSFVVGALMFSLGTFLTRRKSLIVSIFGVIFYAFLVGFEPSIVRASLMAIVVFTASFLGRQMIACVALFLSAFCMLMWQPAFLLDVGFQLSCLATLGILCLQRPVVRLLQPKEHKKKTLLASWQEDLATTIAAEIAILPVILSVFGKVGIVSILVNALVLWTIPLLMVIGSVGVVVGLVFAPLGKLLLLLALPLLLYFEAIVSTLGGLGWNFSLDQLPWPFMVCYYLCLLAALIFLRRRDAV